mmetsp:Transcript_20253/g.58730  ORF Transcript_20253/g.58730 Transcript_20253/m.58730 type:complete len:419 (+) Transcript_20253:348-1604(+)
MPPARHDLKAREPQSIQHLGPPLLGVRIGRGARDRHDGDGAPPIGPGPRRRLRVDHDEGQLRGPGLRRHSRGDALLHLVPGRPGDTCRLLIIASGSPLHRGLRRTRLLFDDGVHPRALLGGAPLDRRPSLPRGAPGLEDQGQPSEHDDVDGRQHRPRLLLNLLDQCGRKWPPLKSQPRSTPRLARRSRSAWTAGIDGELQAQVLWWHQWITTSCRKAQHLDHRCVQPTPLAEFPFTNQPLQLEVGSRGQDVSAVTQLDARRRGRDDHEDEVALGQSGGAAEELEWRLTPGGLVFAQSPQVGAELRELRPWVVAARQAQETPLKLEPRPGEAAKRHAHVLLACGQRLGLQVAAEDCEQCVPRVCQRVRQHSCRLKAAVATAGNPGINLAAHSAASRPIVRNAALILLRRWRWPSDVDQA